MSAKRRTLLGLVVATAALVPGCRGTTAGEVLGAGVSFLAVVAIESLGESDDDCHDDDWDRAPRHGRCDPSPDPPCVRR